MAELASLEPAIAALIALGFKLTSCMLNLADESSTIVVDWTPSPWISRH
jgi:hypothetical protein